MRWAYDFCHLKLLSVFGHGALLLQKLITSSKNIAYEMV